MNKKTFVLTSFLATILTSLQASADDWPTYRQNFHRRGLASHDVDVQTLKLSWQYTANSFPHTAWHGPPKWNAGRGITYLHPQRDYDHVFYTIAVGDHVYFSSSVDNALVCLDANSGKTLWYYATQGATRIPPTFHAGRIYTTCDGGYMYCVDAKKGELLWQYSPVAKENSLVMNNGRLASLWGSRTGVMIFNGVAYAGFGLTPWNNNYFCEVELETGRGKVLHNDSPYTFEGHMALTKNSILVPQGRASLMLYLLKDSVIKDRKGRRSKMEAFSLIRSGSSSNIICGNQDGYLCYNKGSSGDIEIVFPNGVVRRQRSETRAAMVTDKHIVATLGKESVQCYEKNASAKLSRNQKMTPLWSLDFLTYQIIAGPKYLYLGGKDQVAIIQADTGQVLKVLPVSGRAKGLTLAHERLTVSTDNGHIYSFGVNGSGIPKTKIRRTLLVRPSLPKPVVLEEFKLVAGPFVEFTDRDTAVVSWQGSSDTGYLTYGENSLTQKVTATKQGDWYSATLNNLHNRRIYSYQIQQGSSKTKVFELDTWFNYYIPKVAKPVGSFGEKITSHNDSIEQITKRLNGLKGVCLVVGVEDGSFLQALAIKTQLRIIGLDSSSQKRQEIARRLLPLKSYGSRITLLPFTKGEKLNLPGGFANFAIVRNPQVLGQLSMTQEQLLNLVHPKTGFVFHSLKSNEQQNRPPLPYASDWSHLYGNPNNSGYNGEMLMGANHFDELKLQWMGRPGAKFHVDRNGRKPGPVAKSGKMFYQGIERAIMLNSYNGEVLWAKEIPGLMRFNVPRSGGNVCIDDDHVYLAVRDKALILDATRGDVRHVLSPVKRNPKWQYDWGYIATVNKQVYGTAVKTGEMRYQYTSLDGWYDGKGNIKEHEKKILSDSLFSYSAEGKKLWLYNQGLILDSTITITDKSICFLETRHPKILASHSRNVNDQRMWEDIYLVALDLQTGKSMQEIQIPKIARGEIMATMAWKDGRLLLTCTTRTPFAFNLYCYDTTSWKEIWRQRLTMKDKNGKEMPAGHHGTHMRRVAIIGDTIYLQPDILDVKTGYRYQKTIPWSGCGTHIATSQGLISGLGKDGLRFWNTDGTSSRLNRVRPDCWISFTLSDGVLLLPEGGGGCTCRSYMQTSLGLVARKIPALAFATNEQEFVKHFAVNIVNLSGKGEIRYTVDGSEPTAESTKYQGEKSLKISETSTIKAAVFLDGKRVGTLITREFTRLE